MSLQKLPLELLLLTCQYLGTSFFCADVRRMTLYKQWYSCARSVVLADLRLSTKTLVQVLFAPGAAARLELLKSTLRRVELKLDTSPATPPPTKFLENWCYLPLSYRFNAAAEHEEFGRLNDNLSTFSAFLGTCRNLRTLCIAGPSPSLLYSTQVDLYGPTLTGLLSLRNLTTLELDTCRTLITSRHPDTAAPHICPLISSLLFQLRSLRLRVYRLYRSAMSPPEDSDIMYRKLKVLIIDLTPGVISGIPEYTCSEGCTTSFSGFTEMQTEIEENVGLLVERMTEPRIVRILALEISSRKLQALDVLARKRMYIPRSAAWD